MSRPTPVRNWRSGSHTVRMPSTTSPGSSASNCCARSRVKTATSWSPNGSPKKHSRRGRPVRPSRRTPASAPILWPQARRCSSSRLCWTLRGLAPTRNAGQERRSAAGLTVAVALVVALACGCANTGSAPVADAAYGVHIDTNTPQGLRAKQTMDMVNSDWPIGTVGVRTMATPEEVNGITTAMGNLWWDRPITVSSIDIGAGSATLHVLTPYNAAQDVELRTNDAGMVDRFAVTMRPPAITKWADIDAALTKSGARYSYQVSKVVPDGAAGKCVSIAGTNTDLSLPLASIFKLYVLLAVADAVKTGTVSWNDSLTITEQAKAVGSAGRAAGPRCRRACTGGGRASRSGQHDPVPDHARAVLGRLGRAGFTRAVEACLSAGPGAAAAADEFPAVPTGSEPHAHAGLSRRCRVVWQCGRHLPGARRAAGGGGRQGGACQADSLNHSGYRSGQGQVALRRCEGRKPARRSDMQLVRGGPHGPAVGGQLPVELAALLQPDGGGLASVHRAQSVRHGASGLSYRLVRSVQACPRKCITVRLTGAMSMRQNDFGGPLSATRIAARITDGCVTATSRVRRVVSESIHPRTRSISSTTDSPPCGARVGSVSQIARSSGRTPPTTSPRQRPQSRSASRLSMLACSPSSSAVCLARFSGPQ